MKPIARTLSLYALVVLFPMARMADAGVEQVRRILTERLSGATPDHVVASPISGLYEVGVDAQIFYVSADGRYLVSGRVIDLESREDLTERALGTQRLKALARVPDERMIIFEPRDEVKHTLTTFTDIDCPYCRQMHDEMKQLNNAGIRVRYMLFPRTGVDSVSYEKAVSVWCAPNQQEEMTRAKAGEMPTARDCENPVQEHMALARRLGLQGTPFTITDTGRVINGYQPVDQLRQELEFDKQAKQP